MHRTSEGMGWMLRKVFEQISLEPVVKPLSDLVENRLKEAWSERPCPNCGAEGHIRTWDGCDRVRCRSCGHSPRYTSGTPFANKELADGKLLLIFVLYVDTLLSTRAISRLFTHDYDTIADAVDEFETVFLDGFPAVWAAIAPCVGVRRRSMRHHRRVQDTRDRSRHGQVWSDAHRAYLAMEYEHKIVVHDNEFVTEDGVHTNQAECLWSVTEPWLEKFRGLSKDRLQTAVHAFGFMRSLTLVKAPIQGVIDCFALSSLQDLT